jgi:hypothetical protein
MTFTQQTIKTAFAGLYDNELQFGTDL